MTHASLDHASDRKRTPRSRASADRRRARGPDIVGKLLTLISGGILVLGLLPAALLAWLSLSIASNGIQPYGAGLFVCHTQECLDEGWLIGAVAVGYMVLVVVAVVLAVLSTRRSLAVLTGGAFAAALVVQLWILTWDPRDYEAPERLLIMPAIPLLLGLGSALRLWVRY